MSNGGSFYLQSKIYRAHELLLEFQKEKRQEEASRSSKPEEKAKTNNSDGADEQKETKQ